MWEFKQNEMPNLRKFVSKMQQRRINQIMFFR